MACIRSDCIRSIKMAMMGLYLYAFYAEIQIGVKWHDMIINLGFCFRINMNKTQLKVPSFGLIESTIRVSCLIIFRSYYFHIFANLFMK